MRLKILARYSASAAALAFSAAPSLANQTTIEKSAEESQVGSPSPTTTDENLVVVTGIRQSIESAQSIKQDADQIVDVVVAEDIGKLPDITASASLARITGVQVNRAGAEASEVRIRGLPDLSTTYNGREIFTAEGRSVALQDFPAASVAALEVYKSSTADLIEGGIAGQINVRSRRPFDFRGFRAFGAVNAVHFDQSQGVDYNANLLLSNRWQTGIGEIGILVNANIANTNFLDSTREQAFAIQVGVPVAGQPGRYRPATGPEATSGRADAIRYPDAQAVFFADGKRWRPSVNAAFQWRPAPELEFYVDGLFQGYRGRDSDRFLNVPMFGAGIQFSDVVLQPGTNLVESMTATGGQRPEGFAQFFDRNTDTYQFGGGAIYERGPLRVSADIAYTESTAIDAQANVDYALASAPVRDAVFDLPSGDGGPSFSFRNFNLTDPNNFVLRGLFETIREARGDDIQARFDLKYDVDLGPISEVQVGVRYNDRDASRRQGSTDPYRAVEGQRILYPSLPVDLILGPPGFRNTSPTPGRTFVIPERDSIRANVEQLRGIVGVAAPLFNDLETFNANELAYAAYAQVKYEIDVGFPIDGLIGLRAIQTQLTIDGITRNVVPNPSGPGNIVTFVPVVETNDYVDYLPNVSARLRFLPNLQLRAAYTETRTRPNFGQLNPSLNFGNPPAACDPDNRNIPDAGPQHPNCVRNASGGNPNLKPIESTNYDLSLEYYFARAGAATVALFRRDVNGFISRIGDESENDPVFGRLNVNRPYNGGDGTLQGIEVGFNTFFNFGFMPRWAHHFGVRGNYTYIDGGAELPVEQAKDLPGKQAVPGVSEHTYNLAAFYERRAISARLAYNYRSSFVDMYNRVRDLAIPATVGGGLGPFLPVIEEGRGVLDFSASIDPVRNVTIAFDVSNILGEPIRRTRAFNADGDSFPRQVKYLERVFSLGVRVRY